MKYPVFRNDYRIAVKKLMVKIAMAHWIIILPTTINKDTKGGYNCNYLGLWQNDITVIYQFQRIVFMRYYRFIHLSIKLLAKITIRNNSTLYYIWFLLIQRYRKYRYLPHIFLLNFYIIYVNL